MASTDLGSAATGRPASREHRSARGQLWCCESGLLLLILFGAGMVLAHYIPPPGANQTNSQLVADYTSHLTGLRLGLSLMIAASGFYAPWSGALSIQLKRLEGEFSPFAYTELAGAILTSDRTDVYPRWVAWVNLACVPLLLPAVAIPFFKTGALAWQGVLEFWLAAVTFFGWFTLMTVMTLLAIRRQGTESI